MAAGDTIKSGNFTFTQTSIEGVIIVDVKAYGDDRRGDIGAVQISEDMGPHMLHPVDVAHQGLGQVRHIPFSEVSERKPAEPLRHAKAGRLYFIVYQPVSGPVLLQMGEK